MMGSISDKRMFLELVKMKSSSWSLEVLCQLGFCFCSEDEFTICYNATRNVKGPSCEDYSHLPKRFLPPKSRKNFYRKRIDISAEQSLILMSRANTRHTKPSKGFHHTTQKKTYFKEGSTRDKRSDLDTCVSLGNELASFLDDSKPNSTNIEHVPEDKSCSTMVANKISDTFGVSNASMTCTSEQLALRETAKLGEASKVLTLKHARPQRELGGAMSGEVFDDPLNLSCFKRNKMYCLPIGDKTSEGSLRSSSSYPGSECADVFRTGTPYEFILPASTLSPTEFKEYPKISITIQDSANEPTGNSSDCPGISSGPSSLLIGDEEEDRFFKAYNDIFCANREDPEKLSDRELLMLINRKLDAFICIMSDLRRSHLAREEIPRTKHNSMFGRARPPTQAVSTGYLQTPGFESEYHRHLVEPIFHHSTKTRSYSHGVDRNSSNRLELPSSRPYYSSALPPYTGAANVYTYSSDGRATKSPGIVAGMKATQFSKFSSLP